MWWVWLSQGGKLKFTNRPSWKPAGRGRKSCRVCHRMAPARIAYQKPGRAQSILQFDRTAPAAGNSWQVRASLTSATLLQVFHVRSVLGGTVHSERVKDRLLAFGHVVLDENLYRQCPAQTAQAGGRSVVRRRAGGCVGRGEEGVRVAILSD